MFEFLHKSGPHFNKLISSEEITTITIEPKPGLHLQLYHTEITFPGDPSFHFMIEIRDVTSFVEFDNLRKEFVSTVSHELRTPISVIVHSIRNLEKYEDGISPSLRNEIMSSISLNANILAETIL